MSTLATSWGVGVTPLWLGFRVERGDVRVDWVGWLGGPQTRIRRGKQHERREGLLGPSDVDAVLSAWK